MWFEIAVFLTRKWKLLFFQKKIYSLDPEQYKKCAVYIVLTPIFCWVKQVNLCENSSKYWNIFHNCDNLMIIFLVKSLCFPFIFIYFFILCFFFLRIKHPDFDFIRRTIWTFSMTSRDDPSKSFIKTYRSQYSSQRSGEIRYRGSLKIFFICRQQRWKKWPQKKARVSSAFLAREGIWVVFITKLSKSNMNFMMTNCGHAWKNSFIKKRKLQENKNYRNAVVLEEKLHFPRFCHQASLPLNACCQLDLWVKIFAVEPKIGRA